MTEIEELRAEVAALRETLATETKRRQDAEWDAARARQELARMRPVALAAERLHDETPDKREPLLMALLFAVRDWHLLGRR